MPTSRPLIPAAVSLAHAAVFTALAGAWAIEHAPVIPPRPLQAFLYTSPPSLAAREATHPTAEAPRAPRMAAPSTTPVAHPAPATAAPADIVQKAGHTVPAAVNTATSQPTTPAPAAPADSGTVDAPRAASGQGHQGRQENGTDDGPHEARIIASMYSNRPPAYPAASRSLGEEGRVVLKVRVTAAGRPESIDVETSSGFPRLDRAASDAVHRWRFEPAMSQGQPVAGWVRVPVLFRLDTPH